ncbi:MAG TPA: 2Fe-2S iron-sulfur cluster-binding protein [Pirellulales bacterium]|jgi:NADH-quinone oxidoreductase subunit G|nr:2Fe-2S iron-sulfur cluster-binding protein [Pirellulales bacterium]
MGIVLIDGKEVEVGDNERLNGIQAARRAGVEIPYYCWHPGLTVVASCRMCLVETGSRHPETGAITMIPKLVPACQTPAKAGIVFVTNSEAVKQSRARVEEDLLIDHPIDCPICDKAGECLLQDYHFKHGQNQRRADIRPFSSRRRELGETVTLFVDRCVMCSRCVRFTREISGTKELLVINRGSHEEIDVFPGHPLANKMSGNVVDLCPVGALGDKDFLYTQRVWFMQSHPGVCAGCSTGCSILVDENQDTVYRLRPRENPFINKWWMCDEGRYGYHHVHHPERLVEARRHEATGYVNVDWSVIPAELDARLTKAGRLAAVISPHQTVEEAYLLAKLVRQYDPEAPLALGPVPMAGEDERFASGFTIHAEKCPNRRGVEAVLKDFSGAVMTFDEMLDQLDAEKIQAVWVAGGYREPWIDDATAERLAGERLLIVQDLFDSPLWQRATYQLPGASFAERSGSYVNFADRLQSFEWAIRPPAGVWIEGHLYWRMLGMRGLYNPRTVLSEIAANIGYFAAAGDEVPPVGVDLKVSLLASAT